MLAVIGSTGQFGGAEATDIHYVAELVRRGVAVRWALPRDGPLHDRLSAAGVPCDIVPSPPVLDGLSRRYISRRRTWEPRLIVEAARYEARLGRWLRGLRPAAVLATGFRAQLSATPVAASLRLPLAWVASDFVPVEPLPCRVWSAMASIPRLVITYSRAAAEQPALRRSRRKVVIHSGIDLDAFPMGPSERDPLLSLVGHLTPLKNHLGFLEVLETVRRDCPYATGLLAGAHIYSTSDHGEYAEHVRSAVAATNGATLQSLAPEEVPELLRRSAVLLHLSSVPETFGRVCAEAMASGAVVIGYRHGATPEVLGHDGIMVEPGDLAAAAAACRSVLRDDALRRRLAAAGRRRVEAKFTLERAAAAGADALSTALRLT
ncbi:MAG: glycosyltransferase family 4 protein [Thermoleophilia bacterium]